MLNSIALIGAILAGSMGLWLTHNKARAEGRRAYQPVPIRVDERRRRRRG